VDWTAIAERQGPRAIEDRRWMHGHAELSLREFETQAYLRRRLIEIPGMELIEGDWGTGLVAMLAGGRPGPVIAYRADIDALPLTEATGLPFACSRTDTLGGRDVGVMHACGHDVHASILLGVARTLSEVRDEMPGSVLFVLEPAEEVGAGAFAMIEAGVFENGRMPEAIFAVHDHPTLQYGQVGYCPGHSTASVDDFRINVLGKGGHGAYPHKAIDPVVIAAEMVMAFQSIVSREVDAGSEAVLTVGSIHGGTTSNVIPEEVELHGTVRTLTPEVREQVHAALLRTAKGIAAAHGAPEPGIQYSFGTPSMWNDLDLVERTLPLLRRALGEANVIRYEPGMGGEDFSEYQKVVPGFMFRLGVGRPDRAMNIHSATFDPDERAIPLGIRLMAEILMDCLERGTGAHDAGVGAGGH
jgi:amidohydrolase